MHVFVEVADVTEAQKEAQPGPETEPADVWAALGADVDAWLRRRPTLDEAAIAAHPQETAVVVVDMILGFARIGPLRSTRVDALTRPIASFLARLGALGVRTAYRLEDAHTAHAGEFAVYPPHCLAGTAEAEPIPELMEHELFRQAVRVEKNALSVQDRLDLEQVLYDAGIRRVILVGDCTDLCIAANAFPLRFAANAREHALSVVVPMNLVDTFDAPGHPGEAMHRLALYQMGQNGIEIVRWPESDVHAQGGHTRGAT